jgi:nicotinic acid mononucleotide adenylyltransferase
MKECNIVIGRFQPLTNGHIKCINETYKKYGLRTILFIIGVGEDKVDTRHPFPTCSLIPMYKRTLGHLDTIIDIVEVRSADIIRISSICEQLGYKIKTWSCGEDRATAYTQMGERYKERAHLCDDFKVVVFDRTDGISATGIRNAIITRDFHTFYRNTPYQMSKYVYETLMTQLDIVYAKS